MGDEVELDPEQLILNLESMIMKNWEAGDEIRTEKKV